MKKLLLFFAVLFMTGNTLYAQSGSLTVNNYNNACTIYVDMYAMDPTFGHGVCGIRGGCAMMIPPATTGIFYPNPGAFDASVGGPGYCYFTPPPGVAMTYADLVGTTTFQWTDARFQWKCPAAACPTYYLPSGQVSDISPSGNCAGASTTWIGSGCSSAGAAWINSASTGVMDDIILNFY